MADMDEGMRRLGQLTPSEASNWVLIGRTLLELEQISRAAPSGKPWGELLLARLEELGCKVSPGHLYKIRRAASFLFEHTPEALNEADLLEAKISAVEVAERLFRIHPEEGKKALADALGANPTPFVDLQARYAEVLKSKPHMRSARQIAWESRREAETKAPSAQSSAPMASAQSTAQVEMGDASTGPSETLLAQGKDLITRAWADGWRTAEAHLRSALQVKDGEIAELKETVAILKREIEVLEEETRVLAAKVRELRGYEDDD